jgi:cystathionine beta-lyase
MLKPTQCVHEGTIKSTIHQGVNSPIFTSTSSGYLDPEVDVLVYPRHFNTPNQKAVVDKLCALENGEAGLIFSSGMAAISTTLFALLQNGNHAVFQNDLYGGTYRHVAFNLQKYGIDYTFVDAKNLEAVEEAIQSNTRLIYIETPSNPLLKITDIAAVAAIAKRKNLVSVIDNTFATPINQNPLDLGMDIVIHSGTKYLGGHSDICCGAVITSFEIAKRIDSCAHQLGGSLNASTCYLLERSLKTLALRVTRQNENALLISQYLQGCPQIKTVNYPGLENHTGHELAARQMVGFGGMLSFELKLNSKANAASGKERSRRFLKHLKLIRPAPSLGGVETIVCVPAETSHAEVPPKERETMGIKDQLLRLSVGIEDPNDLISDIDQALKAF